MARQRGNLFHRGVLPDIDLVLTVAMGRHQLVHVLRKHKVAYLASSLYGFYILQLDRVPELDSSILSTTAGGQ